MVLLDNQIRFFRSEIGTGGKKIDIEVPNNPMNNLFPDLDEAHCVAGVLEECYCIYIQNLSLVDNAVKLTPYIETNSNSPDCRIQMGIGASGINGAEVSLPIPFMKPPNVEFTDLDTIPSQPLIVKLGPQQIVPIWFNWKTKPETKSQSNVRFTFSVIVERELLPAQENPNIICPPPTVLDPSTGDCVTPLDCDEDEIFDPISRSCKPDPDSGGGTDPIEDCPEHQHRNPTSGLCEPDVVNPPPTGTIKERQFVAVGDFDCNQHSEETMQTILNCIVQSVNNPNNLPLGWVLALGDFSYNDGDQSCFLEMIRDYLGDEIYPKEIYPIIGNHDDEEDGEPSDRQDIINAFGIPSEGYYAFTKENIRFIMMDTQKPLGNGSPQKAFVTAQLQQANADPLIKWKIVCYHKPSVTSTGNDHGQLVSVADNYHALFQQYKVDLVMAGHNHNTEVTYPVIFNTNAPRVPIKNATPQIINSQGSQIMVFQNYVGTVFCVFGGGGRAADTTDMNDTFMAFAQNDYAVGALKLKDNGNTIVLSVRLPPFGDQSSFIMELRK